jgi:hypothetical protein
MRIVEVFFEVMKLRKCRFKSLFHLLELFLKFIDLDHPTLVAQMDRYSFITVLKEHVQNPKMYRLQDWRRFGLYDDQCYVDMDTDSDDDMADD